MTERERFLMQMAPNPYDAAPNWEFGFWDATLPAWHQQGLPIDVNSQSAAHRYFGLENPHFGKGYFLPTGATLCLYPSLPARSLGVRDGHELLIDGDGVTYMQMQEGARTIPHYVDHTLKSRKEWDELYKPRLDPTTPGRFPNVDWEAIHQDFDARGAPRFLYLDGFMGYLRNLMGFEAFAMLPYDDLDLFEEMVETLTRIKEAHLDTLQGHVQIEMAHFWEDICYNAGPIVNPTAFRNIVVPRMKRISDRLRAEFGCRYVSVDCDGNFLALLDGWIEAGVNSITPCEVDAGMDILMLQERYGDRCTFQGGIQKKTLISGPDAIDAELQRVLPAVRRGGYLPHLDHACPANVPLDNYRYYVRRKRELLGCA
ncbi:MAG: hypothetical protein HQ523_09845 [Lentisphaerae bacterium]|nr:hypothetical protein [Lentisphaerota bacterium]